MPQYTGVLFDQRKPFATIHPPQNGAVYEQVGKDGKSRFYNAQHQRVLRDGEQLEKVTEKPKAPPAKPKAAKAGKGDEAALQPEKAQRFGRAAQMKNPATVDDHLITTSDLADWGRGDKEIPFAPDLQAAFEHHFEREVEDETEAGLVLVELGLLEQDELRDFGDAGED